ncbi:hypothetical protein NC653_016254 [Populus alba x Populus x berolinensis]|uniref:Uncharacterized protein n=1 Tax=Populus alba x Populus x berolinensis TaxID=444605 RepID=A0AAD6QMF5_9ROSI|nr:hypothetical protein NC653_016254 [Populus alba x Populus x berolinensis]
MSLSEWLGAMRMEIFSKTGGARGYRKNELLLSKAKSLSSGSIDTIVLHVTTDSNHRYKSCMMGCTTCIRDSYGWPASGPDLGKTYSSIASPQSILVA